MSINVFGFHIFPFSSIIHVFSNLRHTPWDLTVCNFHSNCHKYPRIIWFDLGIIPNFSLINLAACGFFYFFIFGPLQTIALETVHVCVSVCSNLWSCKLHLVQLNIILDSFHRLSLLIRKWTWHSSWENKLRKSIQFVGSKY